MRCATLAGVLGRPSRTPFARALAMPALTRACMSERSNPDSPKAHYVEAGLLAEQGLLSGAGAELNTAKRLRDTRRTRDRRSGWRRNGGR